MKKLFCIGLSILTLLICITSCDFSQVITDFMGDTAESSDETAKMLAALSENRINDAKALMHPHGAPVNSDSALKQMADYLSGLEAESISVSGLSVNFSAGTSGKARQEEVLYEVLLSDSSVIYVNAVYLSDDDCDGFTSFTLVLGIL